MNDSLHPSGTRQRHRRALLIASLLVLAAAPLAACAQTLGRRRLEDFFSGGQLAVARALAAGDVARARQLARGVDLAAPGEHKMTLLWYFILPGQENYAAIRTLVELGVDPDNERIPGGPGNALQSVFVPNKAPYEQTGAKVLAAMLDGGLSPNHHSRGTYVLLQRAVGAGGRLAHVKTLVEHGADIDARDSIGRTALAGAIQTMHPDSAIYLVQQGANFKDPNRGGVTPAWGAYLAVRDTQPGHPIHTQFEQLRDLMIAKGAKWPPDPPEVVREQMRAQGQTPIIPYGHRR